MHKRWRKVGKGREGEVKTGERERERRVRVREGGREGRGGRWLMKEGRRDGVEKENK